MTDQPPKSAYELAMERLRKRDRDQGIEERPLSEEQRARLLARVPVGRLGRGADVAAAVGYLVSDEAAYVTGHTLHVNGGMAML